MRYSTYNAIPHNPKSKKHPYETLENAVFPGFFLFQQIRDADLQIFIDSNRNFIADFPIGLRV